MGFLRLGAVVSLPLLLLACGPKPAEPAKPPPRASAAPQPLVTSPAPEPEPAKLRTGARVPARSADANLEIVARSIEGAMETLKVKVLAAPGDMNTDAFVQVKDATLAFVSQNDSGTLWVRRPVARKDDPLDGSIYVSATRYQPGKRLSLRQTGAVPKHQTASLQGESYLALANSFPWRASYNSPFAAYAIRKLGELGAPPVPKVRPRTPPRGALITPQARTQYGYSDLSQLMGTTTGRTAVQRALMADTKLVTDARNAKRTVAIDKVSPPDLPRADYATMLQRLGRRGAPEPLAAAVPADFWYLRSRSFEAFLDVLDLVDDFGQPAANVLDAQPLERGTSARYLAELGLERTELARVFGPAAIASVAVAGSDPYVHEGTDVTLLFQVKAPPLFETALAKALATHTAVHGATTDKTSEHQGVSIRSTRSADGRIRRERATVAGLELVSNSPAAIRRVIDAALGKAPRLADEADLAFLLARDAGQPDETFGFLSDRFVLSAIGPKQKIAAARRELALGELTAPGLASLLHGWLHGRPPADAKELVSSRLLEPADMKHFDGKPIEWQLGKAARSSYGSMDALEPLIDLPPVDLVTPAEQQAYDAFSQQYRWAWSEYVDPVALRVARDPKRPGRYEMSLRAMPLLMRENREVMQMVGDARVATPTESDGLRVTLGLGEDAPLRRELTRMSGFIGQKLAFDWLGDEVVFGIAERTEVTHAAHPFVRDVLEPPSEEERRSNSWDGMLQVPGYMVVGVRNRVGAALALGVLRKLANDSVPDMFRWIDGGKHRGISVVELASTDRGFMREGLSLSYALCPKAIVFSLSRPVLDQLIDEQLDGKAPHGVLRKEALGRGQLVMELGAKKGSSFATAIGWFISAAMVHQTEVSRFNAEALLRGSPDARANDAGFRSVARATLGVVPVTPDGALYRLAKEGLEDPARGTPYAPVFPAVPVPGAPLAAVISRFERVRTEVSFDEEFGAGGERADSRSFFAKVTLDLRKP
jgi:hypothetical protein